MTSHEKRTQILLSSSLFLNIHSLSMYVLPAQCPFGCRRRRFVREIFLAGDGET
jgi:hypothetical protein